jgi:hypothetical protein
VIYIDKRILDLENPAQEAFASDQKRLVVDAFARYRIVDPLKFYQSVGSVEGANSRLSSLLNSALRRVLAEATLIQVVKVRAGKRARLPPRGPCPLRLRLVPRYRSPYRYRLRWVGKSDGAHKARWPIGLTHRAPR